MPEQDRYEQVMDSFCEIEYYIDGSNKEIHSLLISESSDIIYEKYFGKHDHKTMNLLNSCTKSVISALVGIAIEKGYIKSVHDNALTYLNEYKITEDMYKSNIEIEHLLTMSSGIDWPQYGPDNISDRMGEYRDWIEFILNRPMAAEPGSVVNYSNGDSHLLSAIIHRTTGMTTMEFAARYLFEPLEIKEYCWDVDPQRICIGSSALYLTSRDMAKIGNLFLEQGTWENRQIIPAEWVRSTISEHVKMPTSGGAAGYGYYWWIYPESGLIEAWGGQCQRIALFPGRNIVVVMTAEIGDDYPRSPFSREIYDKVLHSVNSDLL